MALKATKAVSGPWRATVGFNYPPHDTRVEPGDVVNDLPAADARWMADAGIIEPVNAPDDEDGK